MQCENTQLLQGSGLVSGAALTRYEQTRYPSEGVCFAGGARWSSLLIYALQSVNGRNKWLIYSECGETLLKAGLVIFFFCVSS